MMTVADIQNVTFERAVRGYRAEDVDEFLAHVASDFEALTAAYEDVQHREREAAAEAAHQKEDAEKKIYILAEKIEEYRKDEDNLKTALLNAQRLCESVVNEAKQKAENILSEARQKADYMISEASGKYTQMERQYQDRCKYEEKHLTQMRGEVSRFKAMLLSAYKQHIDILDRLPVQDAESPTAAPVPAQPQPQSQQQPQTPPAPAPTEQEQPAVPDMVDAQENPFAAEPQTLIAEQPLEVATQQLPDVYAVQRNKQGAAPRSNSNAQQKKIFSGAPKEIFSPDNEPLLPLDALTGGMPQLDSGHGSFEQYQGIDFED